MIFELARRPPAEYFKNLTHQPFFLDALQCTYTMNALRKSLMTVFLLSFSVYIIRVEPADNMDEDEPSRQNEDVGEPSTSKPTLSALEYAELRKMLELDEDQMIIWQVENGKASQTEIVNAAFKGDMTYIIIKGRPKVRTEDWVVLYWIGKESSGLSAGDAASFTVRLDAIVHSRIKIYRETEGLESSIFRKTFEQIEDQHFTDEAESDSFRSASGHFHPDDAPTEFFVEKVKDEIRFKQVQFSLHYVEDKNICLILNSNDVYIYCGAAAPEPLTKITQKLAQMILEKKPSDTKLVGIYRSYTAWSDLPPEEQEKLQNFAEIFDQPFEEKPLETTEQTLSLDKEDEAPKNDTIVIRIHEEDDGVLIYESVENSPTPISSLKTDDCYLIITGEGSGLLVWMGTKSEMNEREGSAKKAELYLREKNYDKATSINFVDEEAMDVPSEANLGDFIRFMSYLN